MKRKAETIFALCALCVFSLSFLLSQQAPDYGKITGEWQIEISADGEYYYLSMKIEKAETGLKGTISESTGGFTDVPLANIKFDGQTLSFEFTSATPPDGNERLVKVEFKVGDNKLEGTLTVEDLGISGSATATRKVK
jgi:hypothetical protein